MTKYVIGTISDIDTPLTSSLQGSRGLSAWYSGVTDEMLKKEREEILNATVEDIRALAPITKAILETGAVCVVGNEDKIKADSEIYLRRSSRCLHNTKGKKAGTSTQACLQEKF